MFSFKIFILSPLGLSPGMATLLTIPQLNPCLYSSMNAFKKGY